MKNHAGMLRGKNHGRAINIMGSPHETMNGSFGFESLNILDSRILGSYISFTT
jgi:hypothetical protein